MQMYAQAARMSRQQQRRERRKLTNNVDDDDDVDNAKLERLANSFITFCLIRYYANLKQIHFVCYSILFFTLAYGRYMIYSLNIRSALNTGSRHTMHTIALQLL